MRNLCLLFVLTLGCTGERLYKASVGWERWRAGLKEKHVTIPGFDIPYLESGAVGEKPPTIVLLHGFGVSKDVWVRFAAHLPQDARIVVPDLPGFGDSTRDPTQTYDVPSQAVRLRAFLHQLGVRDAHLAGNSMGGAIAAYYTLAYPDDVSSLTLVDASGVLAPEESELRRVIREKGENPLVVGSEADYDRLLAFNFVEVPSIPSSVKRYFVAQSAANKTFTEKIFADVNNPPIDLTSRLADIRVPTLVLWGDTDRVIHPSAGEVYAKNVPNAQHVVMQKCGHAPMFERPKEAADIYMKFFRPLCTGRTCSQ